MRCAILCLFLVGVFAQTITFQLDGSCNKVVESATTGAITNSSDLAACQVSSCSYDVPTAALTCTTAYDTKSIDEVVTAVHFHWKGFTDTAGVPIIAGKMLFTIQPDLAVGSATISAAPANANLTLSLQENPTGKGGRYYVNIHTSWNPKGAFAGLLKGTASTTSLSTVPSTTTGLGGCNPTAAPGVILPSGCVLRCAPVGSESCVISVNQDFATSNCDTLLTQLAADMNCGFQQLTLLNAVPGSIVVTVAVTSGPTTTAAAIITNFQSKVAAGNSAVPVKFVTFQGTTVSSPAMSMNLILLIVLLSMLTVFLVAVVLLLCYKRHQEEKKKRHHSGGLSSTSSTSYSVFSESSDELTPVPGQKNVVVVTQQQRSNPPSSSPAFAAPSGGGQSYRMLYTVQDSGEQIMKCKAGDIVTILPEDLMIEGQWVWASCLGASGYVPKSYISKV